jgi:dTDP-4-dehydrorhamnose reductase
MRLLVFGGWGQLGTELAGVAEGRHELIRPRHAEVDVRDRRAVEETVTAARPDVVVNAAAFHQVERCEEEPETAFAVNAVGAANVARAAAAAGARNVFVSSDYVFGGDQPKGYEEDDPAGPVNVYGVTKATGEWLVRLAPLDSLVVRGSGLFGHAGSSGKGGNFVETIIARAAAGEPLSVADDIVMSPTAARDMAERMVLLLEREAPAGVYHAANAGRCSWYEFARAIVEAAGLSVEIAPRSSAEDSVRRPPCSVLVDTRSAGLGLLPARPWEDALGWYLEHRLEPVRATGGGRR